MFTRQQPAVDAFLATHTADLVQIVLAAYAVVGGHYAAFGADARAAQAVSDAQGFTAALQSGQIDHAAIGRVVATAEGGARIPDIVQMTRVLEARFNQWITLALPPDAPLAQELRARNQQVTVRFGLALATASLTHLAQGLPPADLKADPPV